MSDFINVNFTFYFLHVKLFSLNALKVCLGVRFLEIRFQLLFSVQISRFGLVR
jgi:hypothetical protein